MNCPHCRAAMTPGSYLVHSGWGDFFFFGISSQHLFFHPSGGEKKARALPSGVERPGYHCEECGGIVISGDPSRLRSPEWSCAACGEDVPETFEKCWKCGTGRRESAAPVGDGFRDRPE